MKPAVFIDRDGTLIEDRGYICQFSQAGLFPFTAEALRLFNRAGYLCLVVSNQSAVARGMCSEEQVRELHRFLQEHYRRLDAEIHAFYFCPYLEEAAVPEYRAAHHPWRKPAPGMLLQAAADWGVDLGRSFMIGDEWKDIAAGRRAGCRTVLVHTGKGARFDEAAHAACLPEHRCADLLAAARWITGR